MDLVVVPITVNPTASTCKHRATARRPYRAFVPYYKNVPPQHVPPMDREPYTIIKILKFGTRDSADRRVPTAEPASQPRVGRAPSVIRHAVVRPCATFAVPLVPVPPRPTYAYRVRPVKRHFYARISVLNDTRAICTILFMMYTDRILLDRRNVVISRNRLGS
ncbi:hypothetical protein QTP88_018286 [Uroleucon formosanum]